MLRADAEGYTVFVNDRLARMLGRRSEDMVGRLVFSFVAPESEEAGRRFFKANLEGETATFDLLLMSSAGERVTARMRTSPIYGDSGECVGALAMVQDVGSSRSAEERLRYAEQRLRAHANNSPLGYVEWDGEFRVTGWSEQAERMFGWRADEVIGKHFGEWTFVHEADAERVSETVRRLQDGEESRNISANRNYNKWGQTLHCEWFNSCLYDADGEPASYLSFVQDVTDRKRAEESQRQSEALYRMLADYSGDMLSLHAPDGSYLYVSPASVRLLGRTPEEMVGMSPYELFHPEDAERIRVVHDRLLRDKGQLEIRFRIRRRDGRYVWFESNTRATRDPETGGVTQLITVSRDVTARHEAERRQAWMMRELDHRVRNNLSAIMSLMESTAESSESVEEFRNAFSGRLHALNRTHTLLSQSDWDGASLELLAHETLGAYADADAQSKVMAIEGPHVSLPSNAAGPLAMALHELATNAAKYGALSHNGGRVSVRWGVDRSGGGEVLKLEWCETGGPAVAEPTRRGFGMELIEGAVEYELGGRVEMRFEPRGLCCVMEADLAPLRARDEEERAAREAGGLDG